VRGQLVEANLWNTGIQHESLGSWRVHTEYVERGGKTFTAKEVEKEF